MGSYGPSGRTFFFAKTKSQFFTHVRVARHLRRFEAFRGEDLVCVNGSAKGLKRQSGRSFHENQTRFRAVLVSKVVVQGRERVGEPNPRSATRWPRFWIGGIAVLRVGPQKNANQLAAVFHRVPHRGVECLVIVEPQVLPEPHHGARTTRAAFFWNDFGFGETVFGGIFGPRRSRR